MAPPGPWSLMRENGLPPAVGEYPVVLIIGSFPSRLSLERQLYYANPRNQFWRIMATLFPSLDPVDVLSATNSLKKYRIALWDTIASRAFQPGSMDHTLKDIVPHDIPAFIRDHPTIWCIAVNGRMARGVLIRTLRGESLPDGLKIIFLPSTSPANARVSFDQKVSEWRVITGFLDRGRVDS